MSKRTVRCPHKDKVSDCPECMAILNPPNPNMTYEELRERLSIIIGTSANYVQGDQLIQLFATLCAEVIGPDGEITGYTRRNGELSVDLTESYHNELRKQQRTRLAQLTTKNTEEEK